MDRAIGDPLFAHDFLVEFAHFNSHESLSLYRQHIRYILNKYAGKDGYIPSDNTVDAACDVATVLYTAVKHHQIANYRSAIRMCCAVMDEVIPVLKYTDDDGQLGDEINTAYEMLVDTVPLLRDEDDRKELLDFCVTRFNQQAFRGWDWHEGMRRIAIALCADDEERKALDH